MKQYRELLKKVLNEGKEKDDRTKTGTLSIFGEQVRYNLTKGFPLLTTKKLYIRAIIGELLWFIRGETNIKYLTDNNIHIWNEWATEEGELGPVYGKMWRSWPNHNSTTVDQLKELIKNIKKNPNSRRHIISSWNPSILPNETIEPKENPKNGKQALPPCHCLFQFYINGDKLSCQLYQRSADLFLGVPFNIASYALLTHLIAKVTNLVAYEFIHTFGDLHLYSNHIEKAKIQLEREPKELPNLKINKTIKSIKDLEELEIEDIKIENYNPHPSIKADISI